jgi:hypothetical protein
MKSTLSRGPSGGQAGTGFRREVVASFSAYREAERAVGYLARRRLPPEQIAIVGQGLRVVRENPRRTLVARILEPALVGAAVGALFTLLVSLAGLGGGMAETNFAALAFGTACGALAGLSAERIAAERHLHEPEIRLFADRYDVTVDPGIAKEAARAIDDGQRAAPSDFSRPAG